MSVERAIIIDLDDGPFGGGAGALLRVLRRRGTPFRALSFDPLASGYADTLPDDDIHLIDPDATRERPFEFGSDEIVLATSTRAVEWLERRAGGAQQSLPESLRRQLAVPRHLDLLRRRGVDDLLIADYEIALPGAPDDGRFGGFESGILMSADGRLRRVHGPLALWYELRRSHRGGDSPVAVISTAGKKIGLFAVVVASRRIAASAVVAADAWHESWRPALARSIDDPSWHRFADQVAAFAATDGVFHGVALASTDHSPPRLVAMRPGVPSWIEIVGADGGGFVDAMLGRKLRGAQRLAAGKTLASVPIDSPIRPQDIITRIKSS